MKDIPVYEAKTRLSELLVEVEQGEQFTITRRGVPIARLVSVNAVKGAAVSERQHIAAAIASLRQLRRSVVVDGDARGLIDSGRS